MEDISKQLKKSKKKNRKLYDADLIANAKGGSKTPNFPQIDPDYLQDLQLEMKVLTKLLIFVRQGNNCCQIQKSNKQRSSMREIESKALIIKLVQLHIGISDGFKQKNQHYDNYDS